MFLRWKIRFFTERRGATGLKSLDVDCEKHWIGWPGVCVEQKTEKMTFAVNWKKIIIIRYSYPTNSIKITT